MSHHDPIDYHCNARTVFGYEARLRSQCPSEVDIVSPGDRGALCRRIDRAERLDCIKVFHADKLCPEIACHARCVMRKGMESVNSVTWHSEAPCIGQEI